MANVSSIFTVNFSDVLDLERRLGKYAKSAPAVAATGINRAMRDEKSRVTKTIRKYLAIRAGSMNSRIQTYRATRNDPRGVIVLSEKQPPNVESFTRPRQTKKGVTAILRPGGGRVTFAHAFFATPTRYSAQAREAHTNKTHAGVVFDRIQVGGKRVGRYPIEPVFGPSPVKLVQDNPKVYHDIAGGLADSVEKEIDRAVNLFFLKKKGLA